jgi:hypothetical protein
MGSLVQVHSNGLLDASTDLAGAAVRPSTGPLKLRQMTVNGSATAAGTEVVTGGGYTSGASAPTVAFGAAAAGVSSNSGAISITNWPRAETVTGVEIWDSAGTPLRKWWGALGSSKVMAAADTLSYAIGAITLTMP